jgi:hypothetical protein
MRRGWRNKATDDLHISFFCAIMSFRQMAQYSPLVRLAFRTTFMAIPDYFQEISDFRSPNGHPKQADFVAEGLTEIDPASGNLIWNAGAGLAVINEIISTRFEIAVELYDLVRKLEPMLPDSQIARQLVARGYYAMFLAGRALSLTLCSRRPLH